MAIAAQKLAEQGFVTLALCWFDCREAHPGYDSYPPDYLQHVEISSITDRAIQWLRSSEHVQGKKAKPDAVVSLSPSEMYAGSLPEALIKCVRSYGFSSNCSRFYYLYRQDPGFYYNGHPLIVGTPIPIKKYNEPLLVSYFTNDNVWGPYLAVANLAIEDARPIRVVNSSSDYAFEPSFRNYVELPKTGHVTNCEFPQQQDQMIVKFLKKFIDQ